MVTRRGFLRGMLAATLAPHVKATTAAVETASPVLTTIISTGETISASTPSTFTQALAHFFEQHQAWQTLSQTPVLIDAPTSLANLAVQFGTSVGNVGAALNNVITAEHFPIITELHAASTAGTLPTLLHQHGIAPEHWELLAKQFEYFTYTPQMCLDSEIASNHITGFVNQLAYGDSHNAFFNQIQSNWIVDSKNCLSYPVPQTISSNDAYNKILAKVHDAVLQGEPLEKLFNEFKEYLTPPPNNEASTYERMLDTEFGTQYWTGRTIGAGKVLQGIMPEKNGNLI